MLQQPHAGQQLALESCRALPRLQALRAVPARGGPAALHRTAALFAGENCLLACAPRWKSLGYCGGKCFTHRWGKGASLCGKRLLAVCAAQRGWAHLCVLHGVQLRRVPAALLHTCLFEREQHVCLTNTVRWGGAGRTNNPDFAAVASIPGTPPLCMRLGGTGWAASAAAHSCSVLARLILAHSRFGPALANLPGPSGLLSRSLHTWHVMPCPGEKEGTCSARPCGQHLVPCVRSAPGSVGTCMAMHAPAGWQHTRV